LSCSSSDACVGTSGFKMISMSDLATICNRRSPRPGLDV
jgi:hypothetical protein